MYEHMIHDYTMCENNCIFCEEYVCIECKCVCVWCTCVFAWRGKDKIVRIFQIIVLVINIVFLSNFQLDLLVWIRVKVGFFIFGMPRRCGWKRGTRRPRYGVATISRLLKIIGLFCKIHYRALFQKRHIILNLRDARRPFELDDAFVTL